MGEGTRARGGGSKGFGSGGVGGRGTGHRDGANFATCVVFLMFLTRTKSGKMAFFEGCPVRWGEDTRARGGGSKGFGSRGVGGRGTGPRNGANFATCVVFLTFPNAYKKKKNRVFLKDALGWGRVQGLGEGGPKALVPGG